MHTADAQNHFRVLYEWGSSYAYGGYEYELLSNIFEVIMGLAIASNILLAFFASMMWIMTLGFGASSVNWEHSCRYMLVYCQMLFTLMTLFVTAGLAIAIFHKFTPSIPQIATTVVFIGLLEIPGLYFIGKFVVEELPLEYYHSPLWWRICLYPSIMLSKRQREDIQQAAINRAEMLRERYCIEDKRRMSIQGNDSTAKLLEIAADLIGRSDLDTSIYAKRLEDDLYTDVKHLTGEDVDVLSRYMPRRLAKKVYQLLMMMD